MNNKRAKTLILMSTYQGEKYLAEQIESIRLQTYQDWVLLIRDDGSSDNTLNIIKQYCQQDNRIQFISDTLGNLKPAQSFSALMNQALTMDTSYIFFADQDDYWFPEKLMLQIELLEIMSIQYGTDIPLLVHSDLCVVNYRLETIHFSYLAFEKLTANKKRPLSTLLVNNYITGCTIGMNFALLKIATPIAKTALMHDWWCALIAAVYGKIGFIDKTTVYYRQHGENDIGSQGFYHKINRWDRLKNTIKKNQARFYLRCDQAKSFLSMLNNNDNNFELIRIFSELPYLNRFQRVHALLKLHLQPDGLLRKLGFFLIAFTV